jgi:hypothetical protein
MSADKCTSCEKDYILKKDKCVKNNHIKRMVLLIAGVFALATISNIYINI